MQPRPDSLSRRRFLQAGAAATLGLAALPAVLRAADKDEPKKDDPFGGFKLGVQSYSFRNFDLEPALKRTQTLGLHYIELYQKHLPLTASADQIKAVIKLCKDYDVTPVAYGVEHFSKNDDENKKKFEFGTALGIMGFSASPDMDAFDSLDKMCEQYKLAIAIHPHGPVSKDKLDQWYSAEIIMEAVKDHNPLIGTCLDTGHLIRSAQDPFNKKLVPQDQVRVMKNRNFGMHLKDHDNEKKTDVVYGKGVLDVPEVLKALREVKFKGWISIEYEAHPEEPTEDMQACVGVFKDSVKKLG
jgi:sugar phosphate isomerase/epimerase